MKRSFADDVRTAAEEALTKGGSFELLDVKIYTSNGVVYISEPCQFNDIDIVEYVIPFKIEEDDRVWTMTLSCKYFSKRVMSKLEES